MTSGVQRSAKWKWARLSAKLIKWVLFVCGFFFILLLLFSFTTGPYHIMHWLGTHETRLYKDPDFMVVMGGAAMPGEENLMRTWYAASYANQYPEAIVIITLPSDTSHRGSDIFLMKEELIMRGVDSNRIWLEPAGRNTREEAQAVARMIPSFHARQIAIITSPFHMRRSVLTFRKAGFHYVGGFPAFEGMVTAELEVDSKKLGGNRFVPEIGHSVSLRYQFWNHLKYEISEIREFVAMGYYWLRNWI